MYDVKNKYESKLFHSFFQNQKAHAVFVSSSI